MDHAEVLETGKRVAEDVRVLLEGLLTSWMDAATPQDVPRISSQSAE